MAGKLVIRPFYICRMCGHLIKGEDPYDAPKYQGMSMQALVERMRMGEKIFPLHGNPHYCTKEARREAADWLRKGNPGLVPESPLPEQVGETDFAGVRLIEE
jgi:hypothetical protein